MVERKIKKKHVYYLQYYCKNVNIDNVFQLHFGLFAS